jgi:antitoxin component YwqK of YwqJK toxin-antitoxin module
MKKLIILFALSFLNTGFSQLGNALGELSATSTVPVKPIKDKGKAKIYYELKGFVYIPNTLLIDWNNSIKKIETQESWNPNKIYLIETCKIENGKKNGEFSLTFCKLNQTTLGYYLTDIYDVVSGSYLNDQYNGSISIMSYIDLKEKEGIFKIEYENGKIKDQTIKYPELIKDIIGFSFYPIIDFKDGRVNEILSLDLATNMIFYNKFVKNKCSVIKYTDKPTCYNKFSFLSKEYEDKNINSSLIDLNTNKRSLEIYDCLWNEKEKKYLINGNYRLFRLESKFLDSTNLVASYNFIDGKRNGEAMIWDLNKNGKSNDLPFIKLNFKNDMLEGKSELFYSDGKLALTGSFDKGFPVGEVVSFYNSPNFKVFKLESLVPQWVPNGGILMPYQIGKWCDDDLGQIKTIREKGGTISDLNGYGVYCKITYKLDSIKSNGIWHKGSSATEDYSLFNNGKPMVTYLIDKEKLGQFKNILWKDQTGKLVYSLNDAKQELSVSIENKANEIEKKNNSTVKCEWCVKPIKYGDALILLEREVRCYYSDGDRVNLDLLPFYSGMKYIGKPYCSEKCKMDASKECCRISGYKNEP